MNYGELKQAVIDYSHREDAAPLLDIFLDMTASRIGRHLKSNDNQATVALAMATEGTAVLPADFAEVDFIYNTNTRQVLAPVAYTRLTEYWASGGAIEVFAIRGDVGQKLVSLGAQPGLVADPGLLLGYWQTPAFMRGDADTNHILDTFPQLYIYGALVEVFAWTQDADPRQTSLDTFLGEVSEINDKVRGGSWGTGASHGS